MIWQRLGNVGNYVDPFFGSGAVLLGRPHDPGTETVNDKDAFIANFFRAINTRSGDPAEVAYWCDRPVNEADLHPVHLWLVNQREEFTARVLGDMNYFDAQVAGLWCWGICCWIGGSWCAGDGPWQSVDGQLVHLGDAGQGVHRQRVHLGDAGRGENGLLAWLTALGERLRQVRVCCGDWTRVLGPSVTSAHGLTGILLDPPYQEEERDAVYRVDTAQVAEDVRQWALANGDNPLLRIALCGYGTATYRMPETWEKVGWTPNGGYGNRAQGRGRANKTRETIWFSPHCVQAVQTAFHF